MDNSAYINVNIFDDQWCYEINYNYASCLTSLACNILLYETVQRFVTRLVGSALNSNKHTSTKFLILLFFSVI